jgi:hypothetical protein
MPPLYESTCPLDEFDEKPNHSKNLKEKATKQRIHFFNHLIKQLCSMGSKCLPLDASHL